MHDICVTASGLKNLLNYHLNWHIYTFINNIIIYYKWIGNLLKKNIRNYIRNRIRNLKKNQLKES
jgi:hypothetical protein